MTRITSKYGVSSYEKPSFTVIEYGCHQVFCTSGNTEKLDEVPGLWDE